MPNRPPSRLRSRLVTTLLSVSAVALIVAGCSSSKSSDNTTNAASTSSATSAGVAAGLQEARALVAAHSQRPTSIGVSAPITKPIPTGKKVVFISCGTDTCTLQGSIIAQGAKELGWTASTIVTDGSAPQIQAAMTSAIRSGANGIILNAVPISEFKPELQQAVAKGILFEECCTTDPVGNGLMYVTVTPSDDGTVGEVLGAWVANDSNGTGQALWVQLPIPILEPMAVQFKAALQKFCDGGCQYNELDVPITATATQTTTQIVTFLRAHPAVKYVGLSVDGALGVGLPAALKLAGISGVKVVGEGGTPQIFQYIADGDPEWLSVPFDYYTTDYQMLDAFARKWAGVPVVAPAPWDWWLMTKSDLPSSSTLFPVVANYQSDFLKLWGKS
jgi:ribose transport system substrate-binding protein